MDIVMNLLFDSGKGDYETYQELLFLSTESVNKFIKPDRVLTILTKESNPFKAFKEFAYATFEQVRKGHNVFVVEIDCLAIRPVKIFNKFNKMMLFTRTHPYSMDYQGVKGGWRFDPYMNSGVRYFPATMPREILNKAESLFDYYDESFWGYDQVVYNWMYYQQHENADMNYQKYNWMPFKEFIQDPTEEDAYIVHLFSSRGPKDCLDKMISYYGRYVKDE